MNHVLRMNAHKERKIDAAADISYKELTTFKELNHANQITNYFYLKIQSTGEKIHIINDDEIEEEDNKCLTIILSLKEKKIKDIENIVSGVLATIKTVAAPLKNNQENNSLFFYIIGKIENLKKDIASFISRLVGVDLKLPNFSEDQNSPVPFDDIDRDYNVISSSHSKRNVYGIINGLGVPQEICDGIRDIYFGAPTDPIQYASFLATVFNFAKQTYFSFFGSEKKTKPPNNTNLANDDDFKNNEGGGTEEKPVGTVWLALATPDQIITRKLLLGRVRERVIMEASQHALNLLRKSLIGIKL